MYNTLESLLHKQILSQLPSETDFLCIYGEFKQVLVISLLHFHLCVDAVSNQTI